MSQHLPLSKLFTSQARGEAAAWRRTWWIALFCAASLLAMQGLGHWHRVLHPQGSAQLSSKFALGHESGSADCQLFDHLAHADGACASPSAAISSPPLEQLAPLSAVNPAGRPWGLVCVRGPPQGLS